MENFSQKIKKAIVVGTALLGFEKTNTLSETPLKDIVVTEKMTSEGPVVYAGNDAQTEKLILKHPQKEWLEKNIRSTAYQKRAQHEQLTQEAIDQRADLVANARIYEQTSPFVNNESGIIGKSFIHYNGTRDSVLLGKDVSQKGTTVIHELEHIATGGNMNLSEHARQLYRDSYDPTVYLHSASKVGGKSYPEYLGKETERDVRKKELEYELEKLKIKKYREPFLKGHYQKMMKAFQEGKFSEGATQFIKTTKPEYFARIFNEIAELPDIQDMNTSSKSPDADIQV